MGSDLSTVLLLVAAVIVCFWWMEQEEVTKRRAYFWFRFRTRERDREIARYCKLWAQLKRWLRVRPYLFTGTCPYARGIIMQMIESYEHIVRLAPYIRDDAVFEDLERLLNSRPPHHDPPNKKAPVPGPFSHLLAP